MECLLCRDNGKIGGCPKCGKHLNLKGNNEIKVTNKEINKLCIPKNYVNSKWNSLILKQDYNDYSEDSKFKNYVQQLDACINIFKKGELPKISALISSPIGYGKTTWAYNCMIEAMRHNYTVAPLIATTQMRRMMITASERPDWYNSYSDYSYMEYLTADTLFVYIPTEYAFAYETIVDLVNTRSRLEKPTFFLSNYTIRELISHDKKSMLLKLLNGGSNVDPLKYLISIEFI